MDFHGVERVPVATLRDRHTHGVCHIVVDDNCYVAYLDSDELGFLPTHFLFAELHKAITTLPLLTPTEN